MPFGSPATSDPHTEQPTVCYASGPCRNLLHSADCGFTRPALDISACAHEALSASIVALCKTTRTEGWGQNDSLNDPRQHLRSARSSAELEFFHGIYRELYSKKKASLGIIHTGSNVNSPQQNGRCANLTSIDGADRLNLRRPKQKRHLQML